MLLLEASFPGAKILFRLGMEKYRICGRNKALEGNITERLFKSGKRRTIGKG